jgi:methionine aminopeptidase
VLEHAASEYRSVALNGNSEALARRSLARLYLLYAELNGYYADAAITVVIPPVAPAHQWLRTCAKAALTAA